jgi:hypothetical protein
MALDRPLPVCHDRKRGTHFIPLPGFFRKLFMPDWVEILDLPCKPIRTKRVPEKRR